MTHHIKARSLVIALLALPLSASGCATRTSSAATLIGGSALAIAGTVYLGQGHGPAPGQDPSRLVYVDDGEQECGRGGCSLGWLAVVGGLALAVAGGASLAKATQAPNAPADLFDPPPESAPAAAEPPPVTAGIDIHRNIRGSSRGRLPL